MCTVVYRYSEGRLFLVMNRDERLGRAPESPPTTHPGPPQMMSPTDGEKGGTWIAVNENGMAACLLNSYGPGDTTILPDPEAPSRGTLIPDILTSATRSIDEWIGDGIEAERFPSFTLLVWGRDGGRLVSWRRGEGITQEPLPEGRWAMATSSAWRTKDVVAWRTDLFNRWIKEGQPFDNLLPRFSVLEAPGLEEWSPFMTRPFSATRSLTLVDVDYAAGRAEMMWWPRRGDRFDPKTPPQAHISIALKTGAPA